MLRAALIPLLCVALVLPKATATLAFLLPGSFSTIVICTGTELQTISLDQRGEPVDSAEIHGLECLSETPAPKMRSADVAWQAMHRQFTHAFRRNDAVIFRLAPEDTPSLGRAPPLRPGRSSLTSLA